MTYNNYLDLFNEILTSDKPNAPYDNPDFLNYVQLNHKRQDRWTKKGELKEDLTSTISKIDTPQKWILITEPWCGDAAHAAPFIAKIAEMNPNIQLEIQLRDSGSEIDNYLTNGGKSIPKLVVRDHENEDLFSWGPRPDAAHEIHVNNLNSDKSTEEKKVDLQKWYNKDKGETFQNEIISLLNN